MDEGDEDDEDDEDASDESHFVAVYNLESAVRGPLRRSLRHPPSLTHLVVVRVCLLTLVCPF
jgi:hypothetical protein